MIHESVIFLFISLVWFTRFIKIGDMKQLGDMCKFNNLPNNRMIELMPNCKNLPKIPKLKREKENCEQKQTLLTDYRPLKMMKVHEYIIPPEIEEIEYEGKMSAFSHWESKSPKLMEDPSTYLSLCTTMIHLEECANTKPQREFNSKRIYLKHLSPQGNIFRLEYEVAARLTLVLISL